MHGRARRVAHKTVDVVGVVVELLGDHLAGQVLVIVLLKVADELQRGASGTVVGDHLGLRDGDEHGLEEARGFLAVVDLLRFIDVQYGLQLALDEIHVAEDKRLVERGAVVDVVAVYLSGGLAAADGDRRDEVYNVRALKAVIEVEDDHAQRCTGLELVKLPRVYQRERPRGKRIAAAVYGKRSDTGGHIKNAVVTGTDLPPDRDENDILGKPEIRVHITQQHNNNSFCDRHGKA